MFVGRSQGMVGFAALSMLMLHVVFAAGILLAPVRAAAQAVVECRAELPAARTGYWSWRNVDGKQCWYPGRPGLDKSRLQWPRATLPPDPEQNEAARQLLESYWPDLQELMLELKPRSSPKE